MTLLFIKTDWKFIILAGDPNGLHTADTRLKETWVKLLAEGEDEAFQLF